MRNWAAHELLETTELLRKLIADIEFHAVCAETTTDRELREMLHRHIRSMDNTYHQAVGLLQNKGLDLEAMNIASIHNHGHVQAGMNQNMHIMQAPNSRATRLNDMVMCTLILNSHKAGSMFGMMWANECVDPDVRTLHTMSANNCQIMAYETWQFMNIRGYYQVPTLPTNAVASVTQTFMPSMGTYTGMHHMI